MMRYTTGHCGHGRNEMEKRLRDRKVPQCQFKPRNFCAPFRRNEDALFVCIVTIVYMLRRYSTESINVLDNSQVR